MIKLACFDLDDTLTQEIHSVMLLCILNGKLDQLLEIEEKENSAKLHWIEADHQKAALIKGLSVESIQEGFNQIMKPLLNIADTIDNLKKRDIQSIIITAGPKQVAYAAQISWGFSASYGSDYEVKNGFFTGRILNHIGDKGKIACLEQHCLANNYSPDKCIAIGDGSTDIPLFEYCAKSIAINASLSAIQKATYSIETKDISDILKFI